MVILLVSAVFGRALESDAPTTATRLGRKNVSRSIWRRLTGRPVMSSSRSPSRLGAVTGSVPAFVVPAMSLPCAHRRTGGVRPDLAPRPSPGRLLAEVRHPRCRAPADALTVYDIRVSVDLAAGAGAGPGGRIVGRSTSRYGM